MKALYLLVLLIAFGTPGFGGMYGEHKRIGDQALSENMQIAIQCCSVSLTEVFDAFRGSLHRPDAGVSQYTLRDTLSAITGTTRRFPPSVMCRTETARRAFGEASSDWGWDTALASTSFSTETTLCRSSAQ